MTTSFDELRKNRAAQTEALTKKLTAPTSRAKDETYWNLTRDASGNGSALIRFLPAPQGEEDPYVRLYRYAFQGPTGQWYMENSRTTLGPAAEFPDPVYELNAKLYAQDKDLVNERKQGRVTEYHANIYIVKDPGNPENNGKVFKYKFGPVIMNMLTKVMNPPEDALGEAVASFNPFDLWEGANFKLIVTKGPKKEDWPKYDSSGFTTPGPLFDDDDKLKAVWEAEYPLAEIVAPGQFKTYEQLVNRLNTVLGVDNSVQNLSSLIDAEDKEEIPAPRNQKKVEKPVASETKVADTSDDEDAWYKDLEKELGGDE